MLLQHDADNDDLDRLTALIEVEADILGARRRPLPLAIGAVASALVLLATSPLTSFMVFSVIAFFLALAVYFVLTADAELARRGADQFGAGRDETDRRRQLS